MSKQVKIEQSQDWDEPTQITRITQVDFLAQLEQALARYDLDEDGLLSEDEWQKVAKDHAQTSSKE